MNPVTDWWRQGLTWRTAPLLPLSWLYGLAMGMRSRLYASGILRQSRLRVPVIVVGNITVGGSGKTPLVIHLARALRERGHRPGVISRGYASSTATNAPREVHPDSSPATHGDEPVLIRQRTNCPVFVCPDRPAAGQALLAAYPEVDVILSDDGLQHLALARDFEIAVFDGRGAGNGHLLPAGPLREPTARLDSVDAVVAQGSARIAPGALTMRLEFAEFHSVATPALRCPPALFAQRHGAQVAALAGIGNPMRFFEQLRDLGLVVDAHPFPDHHLYSAEDLSGIGNPVVLMTEKDALKCRAIADDRAWVAPVDAVVDDRLIAAIMEKVLGPQAA